MNNPLPTVTDLHQILVKRQHPGATIIERALQVSNSPEFLLGVANMLREAAQKDLDAENAIIRAIAQSLKN